MYKHDLDLSKYPCELGPDEQIFSEIENGKCRFWYWRHKYNLSWHEWSKWYSNEDEAMDDWNNGIVKFYQQQ